MTEHPQIRVLHAVAGLPPRAWLRHAAGMDLEGDAPENGESLWRRLSVPENEIPVSMAFDAILARTGDVAVFLSGLHVYRNGVRVTLEVRTRERLFDRGGLHLALHESGPSALLLGVQLADGRRCTLEQRGIPTRAGQSSSRKVAEAATAQPSWGCSSRHCHQPE